MMSFPTGFLFKLGDEHRPPPPITKFIPSKNKMKMKEKNPLMKI